MREFDQRFRTPKPGDPAIACRSADATAAPPLPQEFGFDGNVFRDLLRMAGPDLADELAQRFLTDLAQVRQDLRQGIARTDWRAQAHASHVLIALAGTAGAAELERNARGVNLATLAEMPVESAALAAALFAGLDRLIAFITEIATERKAAR
ncbi:hypothetical protein [Pseudorhodobacter sp.]|uniref:hypothetical protein n=1 Tax=Pseudorhodobacter sp. TaxID=1934400 RepID=UPI00264905D9|nr:hypothetical protein [Pseudorhodobacter sp.]MDN5786266.1 hypothetical protein [Pseudorhodobacter sp.]